MLDSWEASLMINFSSHKIFKLVPTSLSITVIEGIGFEVASDWYAGLVLLIEVFLRMDGLG